MVKSVDRREREEEILDLIIRSYIEQSKPISSGYLCERFNLPYSSATVRNIMEALEERGYLLHLHASSGRVPTPIAFKYYVEHLNIQEIVKNFSIDVDFYIQDISDIEGLINYALDKLAQLSGYASLAALYGEDEHFFFRGARFILEQPEFEDIRKIKSLFYALEVKIEEVQSLLFNYLDEEIKVLIGQEIGFKEIADCSLVVSGARKKNISFALALLGPMRMNYVKAIACLEVSKNKLKNILEEFYE